MTGPKLKEQKFYTKFEEQNNKGENLVVDKKTFESYFDLLSKPHSEMMSVAFGSNFGISDDMKSWIINREKIKKGDGLMYKNIVIECGE
mgnify:CR=1 FL=1